MAIKTNIEWCDSSLNIMMGCSHGCELWNPKTGVTACYAGQLTGRWAGRPGWPEAFEKPALFPERLTQALRWPDLAGTERPGKPWLNGLPRLIFLNDMGDTFTEGLPLHWLAPAIELMSDSPHRWLLLTKRPQRMHRFFKEYGRIPWNFWLLTSATDQATWDARVPALIKCREVNPEVTLGVSCEPLLGPIDMHHGYGGIGQIRCDVCGKYEWPDTDDTECPWCGHASETRFEAIDWIIAGGESGQQARPMQPGWARKLREDCRVTHTPFFFKQWGEWAPRGTPFNGEQVFRAGKGDAGRLLDGAEYSQMPMTPDEAL